MSSYAVGGSSVLTVLALLEQLCEPHASVEQLLCGGIQIRTELGESGHLTVLSQLQLHGTSHLENKQQVFYNPLFLHRN